jgi:hypothetical protein
MSCPRTLRCICILAVGLALTLAAGSALASGGLRFSPGPTTLYMPGLSYYQVNAELFNTGDTPQRYHLTLTRNMPEDWTLSVCYDGICYPPQAVEFDIPTDNALEPGTSTLIDLDLTKMFSMGTGTFTVTIVGEDDPTLADHVTYTVYDPSNAPYAFHFATGTTVLGGALNQVSRFHTAVFNSGTQDDAYLVTLTRNQPATWSSTICYDGICYSPVQSTFRVPEADYLMAGHATDIDIDFTPMFESGLGSMHLQITSEANSQITAGYTFYVSTEGLIAVQDETPGALLSQACAAPNPFNPRTEIQFVVGGEQTRAARIDIYDMRGRQLRTLDAGDVAPGAHSVAWDGRDASGASLGAGIYLARVQVGDQCQNVKMSLVK